MSLNDKKVLHIGPSFSGKRGGGMEAVLKIYSANLSPFRFLPSYTYGNILYKAWFTFIFFIRFIKTLIVDREIRAIHVHAASDSSFVRKSIAVIIAKVFRKRIILHMHGGEFSSFYKKAGIIKPYLRFIIRRSDILICLSKQWIEYYSGFLPASKLRILNNPVVTIEHSLVNKKTGKVCFLFLGLIVERKGIYDLLKAISLLDKDVRDKMHLEIGGDGEREKLQQMISDLNISESVTFRGWVDGVLKEELFSKANVYILPSHFEGLPVSILEAMSQGMPVIATSVGGIPEIVIDGKNGYLVNVGDIEAIRESMTKLIVQPMLLESMGKESEILVRPYQDKAVFPALQEIYSTVLQKNAAA